MGRIWEVLGMGNHNTNVLYETSMFSIKSISSIIKKKCEVQLLKVNGWIAGNIDK